MADPPLSMDGSTDSSPTPPPDQPTPKPKPANKPKPKPAKKGTKPPAAAGEQAPPVKSDTQCNRCSTEKKPVYCEVQRNTRGWVRCPSCGWRHKPFTAAKRHAARRRAKLDAVERARNARAS